jgi:SAM-dependent methyltransferase
VKLDEPRYVAEQYRTPGGFDARVRLYELYDRSGERWPAWVFARLRLRAGERVLEIGCGTGLLWSENAAHIPPGIALTLADLSPGMLDASQKRLARLAPQPRFERADVQSLTFASDSFDVAIANHMLYHVPDRPRALAELARVLAPGGRLFAAANVWTHLLELRELVERLGLAGAMLAPRREPEELDLERAADEIAAVFEVESIARRDRALEVTDPDVLVAYVRSVGRTALADGALEPLRTHLARQIALAGSFHLSIGAGLVAARKRSR